MISERDLPPGDGVAAAAELFRRLGYPVDLRKVDLSEWPLSISVDPAVQMFEPCRRGRLDLYFCEATDALFPQAFSVVSELRRRNTVRRPVLVTAGERKRAFSIFRPGSNGTPAARLDVDLGAPRAEVLDRLNALELHDGSDAVDPATLFEKAFDRDSVTRKFFQRFRGAFESVRRAYGALCEATSEEIAAQALLLLSRLLFLTFVQQKGWLDGRRRFLADAFADHEARRASYHAELLDPLFFECLNSPLPVRSERAKALGSIPYLNGGLFQRSRFEREHREVFLGNEVIGPILEDLFEHFWFSVDEGDTDALHVDPEMLGKVFECLMAGEERLATGSFYTPKKVVEAMAERAVLLWATDGDHSLISSLTALLRNEAASIDARSARALLDRLAGIRVLDPACGSGAFLLGALYVLETLVGRLGAIVRERSSPELRRSIVENSLFGVDLKPEAVMLCELRLWLAIVSRSTASIDGIRPLPNLDRNIFQGNSLFSPIDFLATARPDVYIEWSYALKARRDLVAAYRGSVPNERPALARALRDSDLALGTELLRKSVERDEALLRTTNGQGSLEGIERSVAERQGALERRLADSRRQLAKVERNELDFFSYDVHAAHVMASGGFDLVLGNPPWVRNARIDPDTRLRLGDRYDFFRGSGRGLRQPDLALAFCERTLELLAPGGIAALLLPSKFLTASYAAQMRDSVARRFRVEAVDDWSADSVFEADTFPMALTVRNRAASESQVEVAATGESFRLSQTSLARSPGGPWIIAAPAVRRLLDRLHAEFQPLATVLGRSPLMGVKTGANELFFLDDLELRDGEFRACGGKVVLPADALCRVVRGRDVRRWTLTEAHWMLWPPRRGWNPAPRWLRELARLRGFSVESLRLSYVRAEHLGVKVVWKDVARLLQAVVLPAAAFVAGLELPLVPNQTAYMLDCSSLDDAYCTAALLNSTVVDALVLESAERAKDGHFRYYGSKLAMVPLPEIARGSQPFIELVRLSRRAHAGERLQEAVDETVATMYRLRRGELAMLKEFVERRLR